MCHVIGRVIGSHVRHTRYAIRMSRWQGGGGCWRVWGRVLVCGGESVCVCVGGGGVVGVGGGGANLRSSGGSEWRERVMRVVVDPRRVPVQVPVLHPRQSSPPPLPHTHERTTTPPPPPHQHCDCTTPRPFAVARTSAASASPFQHSQGSTATSRGIASPCTSYLRAHGDTHMSNGRTWGYAYGQWARARRAGGGRGAHLTSPARPSPSSPAPPGPQSRGS